MEKDLNHALPKKTPIIFKTNYIKYPFSGIAKNLIDKFLILGYDQKEIEQTLLTEELKDDDIDNKNIFSKNYQFKNRPTLMNEICFNYNKESYDIDMVISFLFPICPKLFFLEKKYAKECDSYEESNNYTMIYSVNPLDNGSSKKSFNGLGYIFYIPKEHRDINNELLGLIYYPITYVILSEYPFFYHFNNICHNIHIQMNKKTDEIPIDIILYNAIKFCPSPINSNINLSFGAQLTAKKTINSDDILNQLNSKNKNEKLNEIPLFFFNQLSGYPFMDINMSFIFNILEPEIIIRTFILTFLECDIIFYSSTPFFLNMVMYIFANLSYPLNQSIYYWHVLSVSKFKFMNDANSVFLGKTSTSMYGICEEYDEQLLTTNKIKHHFFLDIDNKVLSLSFREETAEVNDLFKLDQYIHDCIPKLFIQDNNINGNDKNELDKENYNDGINLYESIQNLAAILNRRFISVTNVNYNEKNYSPSFLIPYENESEVDTMRENLAIQKAFYNFIVQITASIIREFPVETYQMEDNSKNRNLPLMIKLPKKQKDEEEQDIEKSDGYIAGIIFKKLFKDSDKYSSFLKNFCQYHDCVNIYKIPYSFIYESIYFSRISPNYYLNTIDIFLIIDQFYGKIKKLDFIEMIKEKEELGKLEKSYLINSLKFEYKSTELDLFRKISNFSYDKFENYYKDNLRGFINREQDDDKNIFIKDHGTSKQYKTFKRTNFYLSQRILNIYINYFNNNFEHLQNAFKLINSDIKINEIENKDIINNINNNSKISNIIDDKKFIVLNASEKLYNIAGTNNNKDEAIKEKENLKLFGSYELLEISDLIEKHFIKEKYFSAYEIIKFSLLNLIAITINMKNKQINNVEVIKIMTDFCFATNSLVRRYMDIYLNIFVIMKINKWMDDSICDKCIKIIISYFKKTKTFPSEDTINPILNSGIKNYNEDINVDYQSLNTFKKGTKNNREKRAEFYRKLEVKKEEEVIDYIEKVYTGGYYAKNKLAKNIEYYAKKFGNLYKAIVKKGDFVPKTPLELYAVTNRLLFEYLTKFSIEKNEYPEIGFIVLSLLYYFKMEFFLPKWPLRIKVKDNDIFKNNAQVNIGKVEIEYIKELAKKIIFILLDLYETIVDNINK